MECGSCTACCTTLPIKALDKPINTHCQHCVGGGCSIYDSKPQTCTEFECAYIQGSNVPESLRPDKCGVIFIKQDDNTFKGVLIPNMEVTDIAKAQMNDFMKQGFKVIHGYL